MTGHDVVRHGITTLAVLVAAALVAATVMSDPGAEAGEVASATATPPSPTAPLPMPSPARASTNVLVGAGNVADCAQTTDDATANLLDDLDGTIFTVGDNAYDHGTPAEFAECYGPGWGRHKERTRFPAPGNHDWGTEGAGGYRGYFGTAATPNGVTWYSADFAGWHIVVLDSTCHVVGGCSEGSPQLTWLRADLAATDARCTLAIWHRPRFSSGPGGVQESVRPFWDVLHEFRADVVVNAHDHLYERFAPQRPDGTADEAGGIRQFIVGTGGAELMSIVRTLPNSEFRDDRDHGVLRLVLGADGYDWEFLRIDAPRRVDLGHGTCH